MREDWWFFSARDVREGFPRVSWLRAKRFQWGGQRFFPIRPTPSLAFCAPVARVVYRLQPALHPRLLPALLQFYDGAIGLSVPWRLFFGHRRIRVARAAPEPVAADLARKAWLRRCCCRCRHELTSSGLIGACFRPKGGSCLGVPGGLRGMVKIGGLRKRTLQRPA